MQASHLEHVMSPSMNIDSPKAPSTVTDQVLPQGTSHETPKRPCPTENRTPMIQVTWRVKESNNAPSSDNVAGHSIRRTPGTINHIHHSARPSHMGGNARSLSVGSMNPTVDQSSGGYSKWILHGSPIPAVQRIRSVGSSSDAFETPDLKGRINQIKASASNGFANLDMTTGQNQDFTASSTSPPKLNSTPNRASMTKKFIFNPFESAVDLIETMNCSSLSPSVFSTVLTPSKETGGMLSWSVDNIALLYPTDIEENPNQETPSKPLDPEMEEKLQSAINSFFAQKSFAPSPWLENEQRMGPFESSNISSPHLADIADVSCAKTLKKPNVQRINVDKKDAWCQTLLTLPLNFDLERVLATYFTFNGNQQCDEQQQPPNDDDHSEKSSLSESKDGLSVSSLRRKLFANYEENPRPPSRVGSPLDHADDPVFLLNLSPRTPDGGNTPTTIAASQFSSSPIVLMRGPAPHRTTMTPPTDETSPTLSPIKFFDSNQEACQPVDHEVSFMSTERSQSHTPIENLRQGDTYDNMSVLQEYPSICAGFPCMTGSTKTSFMDVAFEGDATDQSPLISQLTTASTTTSQDLGYQTMTSSVDENKGQCSALVVKDDASAASNT